MSLKNYTAFCSMPDSPRGHYDEEIDVRAVNSAQARRKAQEILETDYAPGMKIRLVVPSTFITVTSW